MERTSYLGLRLWEVFDPPERQKGENQPINGWASTVIQSKGLVLFFGGESCEDFFNVVQSNTLKAFDTEKFKWREYKNAVGDVPLERGWSRMCVLKGRVYLFGGCRLDRLGVEFYNDLYSFSIDDLDGDTICWRRIEGSGDIPCERSSHSLDAFGEHLILIGGGSYATKSDSLNDVYTFNVEKKVWKRIDVETEKEDHMFSKRWGHTTCIMGDSLYLFGGNEFADYIWYNDFWKCRKLDVEGDSIPAPRHGHAMVLHDRNLIVMGGYQRTQGQRSTTYFDDTWCINLDTMEWRCLNVLSGLDRKLTSIGYLSGHCAGLVGNKIVIAGGRMEDKVANKKTLLISIGPSSLKEICIDKMLRDWPHWEKTITAEERALPFELIEQVLAIQRHIFKF